MRKDQSLFSLIRSKLYTPVLGDVLDRLGYRHQFLPAEIRALVPTMKIVGRAMPVLQADVFGPQKAPFGLMTQALDALREGEVYVGTGGTMQSANWGEILTATAKKRGAVGAILNGYHRDTPQILSQDWPVFSRGAWAQDSGPRTKVIDFRCNIEIGGVYIQPGDLVFADIDGVVFVPRAAEKEAIAAALEKAAAEKTVRAAIERGMSSTRAFKKYGVL